MGVSEEPERIEVELLSGDASGSPFARPDAAAHGITGPPDDRPHRRMVVIASAVALVALALGWSLGRAASEPSSGPVAAATSTTAARTPIDPIDPTDSASNDEADVVPATSPVVATDEADESTNDALQDADTPDTARVEIAAAVAGQPFEIVTYGNGQLLQRLDLTAATLTTQRVRRQPFGRPRLIVGDDWVMLPTADQELPTITVDDSGEVSEGSFEPSWQLAGTTDGTGLWVMSAELAAGGAGTIDRRPITGGPADVVALPGPPSRFDPMGGFVVDAPGGSYRVTDEAVELITTGELIAIGRDVALAEECDAELVCTVVVIDRTSGERRPLSVERPLDASVLTSIAIIGGESVSPDGTRAMVQVVNPGDRSSGQPTIGVIDLASGEVSEVGPAQDIDQSVWSPDGRFLFYNRGGKVVAFEPATGDAHVVAEELIAVDAFGVRPLTDPS